MPTRALLVLVTTVLVSGCGGQSERQNAAKTPADNVDRTAAEVLAMPNFFNNVASKCDGHGHRVFVTSNKETVPSNIAVIDDASCGR